MSWVAGASEEGPVGPDEASLHQACFFDVFPPPRVPRNAEKLSLAKNSLSLAKKFLSLAKKSLSLAKKPLSLTKIPQG